MQVRHALFILVVILVLGVLWPQSAAADAGGAGGVLAQSAMPSVSALSGSAWYWRWGAMLGFTAVVVLVCFKNPKRSHDN